MTEASVPHTAPGGLAPGAPIPLPNEFSYLQPSFFGISPWQKTQAPQPDRIANIRILSLKSAQISFRAIAQESPQDSSRQMQAFLAKIAGARPMTRGRGGAPGGMPPAPKSIPPRRGSLQGVHWPFPALKPGDSVVTKQVPNWEKSGQTLHHPKTPHPRTSIGDWRILLHPVKTCNLALDPLSRR
jgi:hypothetical protein